MSRPHLEELIVTINGKEHTGHLEVNGKTGTFTVYCRDLTPEHAQIGNSSTAGIEHVAKIILRRMIEKDSQV